MTIFYSKFINKQVSLLIFSIKKANHKKRKNFRLMSLSFQVYAKISRVTSFIWFLIRLKIKFRIYQFELNIRNETRSHFVKVNRMEIPKITSKNQLHYPRQNVHSVVGVLMAIELFWITHFLRKRWILFFHNHQCNDV